MKKYTAIILFLILFGGISFGEYLGAFHQGDNFSIYKFVADPLTGATITSHPPTFGVFHAQDKNSPLMYGYMDEIGEIFNSGFLVSFVLTEANGFEPGEMYHVYYRVIIDDATYSTSDSFQILHATSEIVFPTIPSVEDILTAQIESYNQSGSVAERIILAASREIAPGAIRFDYELRQPPVIGTPIPDVSVWVTTDSEGRNVIHSGMTDQFGIATFWIDAGTSYFWRHKTGFNFINPDVRYISE